MKKIVLAVLVILGAGNSIAKADVSFRVGVSIGDRGGYSHRPPVVVAPAPVIVAPPVCAPVVVAPAPCAPPVVWGAPVVVYRPAPVYYAPRGYYHGGYPRYEHGGGHGYSHGHGHGHGRR